MPGPDIFLSYNREDAARAKQFADSFAAEGFYVWWDVELRSGEAYDEVTENALHEAKAVVVLWSPRSVVSRWVRAEATIADRNKTLVPAMIEPCRRPVMFELTQTAELSHWHGDRKDPAWEAFVADIRRHIGRELSADAKPVAPAAAAPASGSPSSSGIKRRLVLGGGAVAGLAIAGGLGWRFLHNSPAGLDSLAVLPFANLSGDPKQAYFSDGLAEELRTALARIAGLKVIGRTSSEMLRNDDAMVAAKKLDVASILTGSVRRSPSTVRVSAQLVDGRSGVEQWSQSFDRPNGDALSIQTSIAQAVVQQLRNHFSASDKAAIEVGGTNNSAAQDLVLKAQALISGSEEDYRSQIAYCDSAIALDPKYALAYAGKAIWGTYLLAYYNHDVDQLPTKLNALAAVARKAIALAPNLPIAHYALGENRYALNQYREGWKQYEIALATAGCPPDVMLGVANSFGAIGKQDQAVRVIRAAEQIDPLNPAVDLVKGFNAIFTRKYSEAVELFKRFLAQKPGSGRGKMGLANALTLARNYPEALNVVDRMPANFSHHWVIPAVIAARTGDKAKARRILDDMRRTFGAPDAYQYVQILSQIGDIDGAIGELKAAVRFHDPGLQWMLTDPLLDPLRQDPRYTAIVTKLDFPQV